MRTRRVPTKRPSRSRASRPAPGRPRSKAATAGKPTRPALLERNCSVGRTIDVIGDGWSFMVLRECYFGTRRFEQFKSMLGLPRTTLSDRLRRLTSLGVLEELPYSTRPPRNEYHLTPAGIDLYSVMLALMNFGDKWLAGPEGKPLQLIHKRCGKPCSAMVACSACNQEVRASEVSYRDGPGAGTSVIHLHRSTRRSADPTALERRRPSSVARTLQVIGDRWSFMILREAFLRTRRFDDLQARLGIAPNILADRLARLVESGVFRRERYQTGPDRHEYRFTELGRDLYNPMIVMLRWGDSWLSNGKPPMILRHATCGRDFNATVVCDQCGQPLDAREMGYVTRYAQPPRVR